MSINKGVCMCVCEMGLVTMEEVTVTDGKYEYQYRCVCEMELATTEEVAVASGNCEYQCRCICV